MTTIQVSYRPKLHPEKPRMLFPRPNSASVRYDAEGADRALFAFLGAVPPGAIRNPSKWCCLGHRRRLNRLQCDCLSVSLPAFVMGGFRLARWEPSEAFSLRLDNAQPTASQPGLRRYGPAQQLDFFVSGLISNARERMRSRGASGGVSGFLISLLSPT